MTNHAKLQAWAKEIEALCEPDRVHWCDGSRAEYDEMVRLLVESGAATKLDEAKK